MSKIDYLFELKKVILLFKRLYLKFKNRNKFFVNDYKEKREDEYFFYKKISNNEYGVFKNRSEPPIRIYKKPEHNNPKKLSKQYAKKLAFKKANGIN